LGTINCPNTSSPTISLNVFSFPSDFITSFGFFALPNFPSWIFYNSYEAQIQFGPDTTFLCPGDTLLLNAGEGTSWSWGGDASTNTSQFYTVTSPGIFSATVTSTCGLGSENTEVIILNRWGNAVFSSANYQNNWDGKDTSGKELADGVYTYKFTTETGTIGHGFVHLIR